ncbi:MULTISPECIES: hypothetical protein [Bacillus cereus group]|uniref:hypothetical protein n=1 Tax=Bacillus cereus group TaxID=86661 RepID=UPI0005AF1026|nr:hypothetical protein [Bacillus cereus]KIP25845.1 putative membrane protein [Bacillus thuringiensis serovar morrisoni]MED2075021.1 hypothetical protein [Bacillus thuringiensis]NUW47930.1 hypothetical protein [Bacillus thuringiensis]PDZ24334.1 hypothetical protein CON41_03575 [Bacillus cereus]PFC21447.1 hypothetical protein CN287_03820 [Bacillus cereus]
MKDRKKEKNTRVNLLIVAFVLLVVTKIIGNAVIGGLSVVFAMAVLASAITARIGEFMRKRKGKEDV